jgi:hypothetical protein
MSRDVGKRKLQKELRDLNACPPANVAAVTVLEKNLYDFYALLQGPGGTPYEGGWYIAKLRFPVRVVEIREGAGAGTRSQRALLRRSLSLSGACSASRLRPA